MNCLKNHPTSHADICRVLSDHSNEGILVIDIASRTVLEANARIGHFFGVDAATLIHRDVEEMCTAFTPALHDPETFCRAMHGHLELPEAGGRFDVIMEHTGEPTMLAYAAPIRNEHGEVTAKLFTFHDASQQRSLEKGLRESQKLETAARLAAGIVHDSNNLLTVVLGQLYVAEEQLRAVPGAAEAVEPAVDAANKCADLLRTILKLSREQENSLEVVQCEDVLEEVGALVRAATPTTISIETCYEKNLPPVLANPTQLHQVVMNLVLNAIDAMPDGGDIEISVTRQGSDLCLAVKDSGEGIPAQVQDRIFDAFFTTKEKDKGTGLGLHMVAAIVKAHHGAISCESEPGTGTTFRIVLPAATREHTETGTSAAMCSSHVEAVSS